MPVNAPRYFAVCGLMRNGDVCVIAPNVRGGKKPYTQETVALIRKCVAVCSVDNTFTSQVDALIAVAKELLAPVIKFIDKSAPRPFNVRL